MKRVLRIAAAALAALILVACEKPADPGEKPLSFWADPNNGETQDKCVIATAQAILKSGLPYPNITTEKYTDAQGQERTRNKTIDVWVGSTRYVMPAALVQSNGMYPRNHPARYWKLGGALPNFYPPGAPGPVVDGMGPMVDVTIVCSMEPEYLASWGKGYRSNEEGIARVRARYEERLKLNPEIAGFVNVSRRADLRMTEVLMDRVREANGRRAWEASYWPVERELKDPHGGVYEIRCEIRHDPDRRYGRRGWRCASGMRLSPESFVGIEIYVSHLAHMPAIFDQVALLFEQAKQ